VALGTQEGTIIVPSRSGGTEIRRVPPDPDSLAAIARASGGKAFTAQTGSRLGEIYGKLGSQLGRKNQKRQITSTFAGGALALLLAGIAMSTRWFGRLI
jgi:Ca-activated chloride channel family protein